jgi:hypothetical protein
MSKLSKYGPAGVSVVTLVALFFTGVPNEIQSTLPVLGFFEEFQVVVGVYLSAVVFSYALESTVGKVILSHNESEENKGRFVLLNNALEMYIIGFSLAVFSAAVTFDIPVEAVLAEMLVVVSVLFGARVLILVLVQIGEKWTMNESNNEDEEE